MAKYDALQQHLASLSTDEWNASFSEIERILGFSLPASATTYPAWWANQNGAGHSQAQAWRDAGWQTGDLDLQGRFVRFRRMTNRREPVFFMKAGGEAPDQRLAETARQYSGIEAEQDLVREGLKALIEREAARQLARLGGTMPDFTPAPRRPVE